MSVALVVFLLSAASQGHTGANQNVAVRAETTDCPLPIISQCSVKVLTVPENGRLLLSCLVQSVDPKLVIHMNWTRKNGYMNESRTSATVGMQGPFWNASLEIRNVQKSDEGMYALNASYACGEAQYKVQVLVQKDGCGNYRPPNATRIMSKGAEIKEGSAFSILCYFNGDTQSAHYAVLWSKDSIRDLVSRGPPAKYQPERSNGCPSCCFFTAQLVVNNAASNDSGTYSCSAFSTDHRHTAGSPLSLYLKVQSNQPSNIGELTDIAVGILSGGAVLFLSVIIILCYISCSHIKTRQRKKFNLLINDDSSTTLYGSVALNPPSHATSGTSDVFILYGLELEKFRNIRKVDSPAHTLIMDFVHFLEILRISCSHDAHEDSSVKLRSFTAKIEQRIMGAKVVIVVCSEVLYTASSKTTASTMVQMKFGRFNAQRILGCIAACPDKFVPVRLAGHPPAPQELEGRRQFNMKGFEALLQLERRGNLEEALKKPELSEIKAFVQHIRQLI